MSAVILCVLLLREVLEQLESQVSTHEENKKDRHKSSKGRFVVGFTVESDTDRRSEAILAPYFFLAARCAHFVVCML